MREGKQRMLRVIFIPLFTVYSSLFFLISQDSRSTAASITHHWPRNKMSTSVKWWDTIQRDTQKINNSQKVKEKFAV
jgi:hypothetical protein